MKSVIVTWYDAYTLDEWHTKLELIETLTNTPKGEPTRSQGFLFEDSEDRVILVQSIQDESVTKDSLAGLIIIPRGMIKGVEILKDD